jgi:hypothetical protein
MVRFYSLPTTLVLLALIASSCQKSDNPDDNNGNPDSSKSVLVSKANGFQYIGSFEETDAPVYYAFPYEFYIDDYLDNDRVLVMCQSTPDNPPLRTKWYILNYKDGKVTQSYTPPDGFGPGWGNFMQFSFDHENFILKSWETNEKYYYHIDPQGVESSYFITGGNTLPTFFINKHLLRMISGISIWPYHTNWLQDETQYLLTGELSAMYALDYYFDNTYETEKENSIYTGYFYPSYDGNWIGIGRGNQRLDTLLIDKELPLMYNQYLCFTYVEKVGNKIYLAFIKNKFNPNTDQDLSMYELNIGENILKPLFVNMALPPDENYKIEALRNGKLYFFPTANADDQTPYTISSTGAREDFLMPEYNNATLLRKTFGKKYLYLTVTEGPKRLEFYKKDLFN